MLSMTERENEWKIEKLMVRRPYYDDAGVNGKKIRSFLENDRKKLPLFFFQKQQKKYSAVFEKRSNLFKSFFLLFLEKQRNFKK